MNYNLKKKKNKEDAIDLWRIGLFTFHKKWNTSSLNYFLKHPIDFEFVSFEGQKNVSVLF